VRARCLINFNMLVSMCLAHFTMALCQAFDWALIRLCAELLSIGATGCYPQRFKLLVFVVFV
jgi:hypothetical protein